MWFDLSVLFGILAGLAGALGQNKTTTGNLTVTSITITNGKIGPGAGGAAAGGAATTPATAAANDVPLQLQLQLSTSASTIAKSLGDLGKALSATGSKSSASNLTAECLVEGKVKGTNRNHFLTSPITLAILADSITPQLLDSIRIIAKAGANSTTIQPICKAGTDKMSVTLTVAKDDVIPKVKWSDCKIQYSFATTPWSVAKYEFWPDAEPVNLRPTPAQARAWLDFAFSPTADAAAAKAAAVPQTKSGGQTAPSMAASNFGTLVAIGAVFATSSTQSKTKTQSKLILGKPDITLFDKDTEFKVDNVGLQAGANHIRYDFADNMVSIARYYVVHLPAANEWPKSGLAHVSLPVTTDYLVVNGSTKYALPAAPIEIYDDTGEIYDDKGEIDDDKGGAPVFAGKAGRLAKQGDGAQTPIRNDRTPVVAPNSQLVRVNSSLPPAQATVTAQDVWVASRNVPKHTSAVKFSIGEAEAKAYDNAEQDSGVRTPYFLFLPAMGLSGARNWEWKDFVCIGYKSVHCTITQDKTMDIPLDSQSASDLESLGRQLDDANKDIVKWQRESQRMKERFSEAQAYASGDTGEAHLYELQAQIRTTSDRLEIARRDRAATELQISRILKQSVDAEAAPR